MRIALALLVLLAVGCESRPDRDALATWRKEAQEADDHLRAETSKADAGAQWTLHIGGQVGTPLDLPLSEVQQSSDATDVTVPQIDVREERVFRGPKLSALVDRAQPRPDAVSVTVIAKDGYFATIDLVHLRALPFILAFAQDGKPSLPAQGGPLSVRFDPRVIGDELQRRYQLSDVFYVTHIIVGDEPARLRIGKRVLDDAALDQLPEISKKETVSYRTGWEPTPQALWGVRLSDAAGAAGASKPLPAMRLFGKDESHDPKASNLAPTFSSLDIDRCDPVLIRRYGADRARIPTRRGGPLLLWVKPVCREALGRSAWLPFVEHVELATQ